MVKNDKNNKNRNAHKIALDDKHHTTLWKERFQLWKKDKKQI